MPSEGKQDEQTESSTDVNGLPALLKAQGHSLEITGLGIVASLILAFWSLVSDGTLPLSQYLVFVSFLLVSAGGMIWRLWKLNPRRNGASGSALKPGVYRVTFGDRSYR
jgi:hypothetical protein